MVAKENDDDVGNLLLFVFLVLNDDEEDKNTFLEEEEEEEKVLFALLFFIVVVVVAIRPRSARLIIIITLSYEERVQIDWRSEHDFLSKNTSLRAHKKTSLFKKKKEKRNHIQCLIKKRLIHQTTRKDPRKHGVF